MSKNKVALLADIHSNYYAFKACFHDAVSKGAKCFVFLGDYVSDLADARRTMDLVYEIKEKYKCYFLRGNRERYMLEQKSGAANFSKGAKSGSLLYTFEQLNEEDFAFFASLPIHDRINLYGIDFEIAHSLKDNDRHYFEQNDGFIYNVFSQMETDYFLTGHAHRQYRQCYQGKTIINCGSVGVPRGYKNLCQYAILEIENGEVECHLHQIEYDLTVLIKRQFESGIIDYAKYWATSILYDVITGEEYTMVLLDNVIQRAKEDEKLIKNEDLWRECAESLGIRFTEDEILEFYSKSNI